MGQKMCTSPVLPDRPQVEECIANGTGGGGCFDARTNHESVRPSLLNFECKSASDNELTEEWINSVLKACRQ